MLRPTRWTSILAAFAAPALVACGGPGSFEGTINGLTLDVKESFFIPLTDGAGNLGGLELVMSNRAGLCEAFKASADLRSSINLLAVLQENDGGGLVPPTPGDYLAPFDGSSTPPIRSNSTVIVSKDQFCQITQGAQVDSGRVTVTAFQAQPGGTMTGSFDLSFSGGDRGTGTFHATFCDVRGAVSTCR